MNWNYYSPQFDFNKYLRDEDSAWIGHINFAYDLVRNIDPKIIVELGTHRGHSFFSLAQAVKDGRLKTSLYAIDSWEGDSHAGFYGERIYKEVEKIVKDEYQKADITLLRGYFQDFVNDFNNNTIDILHIDGLHTYKAVKNDFEMWLPKMKKTGVVLIHDISERKKGFGVYKLWSELEEKYCTVSMEHSHGLGIIFLSNPICEKLEIHKDAWQKYYLKCYQLLKQKQEISEIRDRGIKLDKTINEISIESQNKDEKIRKLELELFSIQSSRTWKIRNKIKRVGNHKGESDV